MRTVSGFLGRAVIVTVAVAAVARIVHHLTAPSGGSAVLPPVTGDTWPPVPVKSSR